MAEKLLSKANVKLKYMDNVWTMQIFKFTCKNVLCNALILSNFDYASTTWYTGLNQNTKIKFQTCQNKVIRFINNWGPRAHTGVTELVSMNGLNVNSRVDQMKLNFVHRIKHGNSPEYLSKDFVNLSAVHNYGTRGHAHNFHVSSHSKHSFVSSGLKLWNALPDNIKQVTESDVFKKKIKSICQMKCWEQRTQHTEIVCNNNYFKLFYRILVCTCI